MSKLSELRLPPRQVNFEGKPRRVGVELEFAAVNAERVARRVAALYGGEIVREDAHRYHINDTRFGPFIAELDTQYAHRNPAEPAHETQGLGGLFEGLRETMREIYGDVGSLVIPYEVVCPPIAVSDLPQLENLRLALKDEGALGTKDHLLHAFGAQFNPDIATRDPGWIMAVLKSQILLSDWLRAIMTIDMSRQFMAFADPFPTGYVQRVLEPDYWPETDRLIEDYLAENPTRNRELDMLPLFSWLDPDRVSSRVKSSLVKARPTFHYRLPDANISQPDWSLTLEWNRWCVVERLAEDRDALAEMGDAYLENARRFIRDEWALRCTEWLVL